MWSIVRHSSFRDNYKIFLKFSPKCKKLVVKLGPFLQGTFKNFKMKGIVGSY